MFPSGDTIRLHPPASFISTLSRIKLFGVLLNYCVLKLQIL